MFFTDEIHLDLPFERVQEVLLGSPRAWLPGAPAVRQTGEDPTRIRVGFHMGARFAKLVEVFVAPATVIPGRVSLPMRWHATGLLALFPLLDANLIAEAQEPGRCKLTLQAAYRAPLGYLGEAADALLMHRAAEATLREFIAGVGARLVAAVDEASSGQLPHKKGGRSR